MKSEVPGREPGIFPLVRHRKDFGRVEMLPIMIPSILSPSRRRRISGITFDPIPDIETVALFAPDHSGKGLAFNSAQVLSRDPALHFRIKFVSFRTPRVKD